MYFFGSGMNTLAMIASTTVVTAFSSGSAISFRTSSQLSFKILLTSIPTIFIFFKSYYFKQSDLFTCFSFFDSQKIINFEVSSLNRVNHVGFVVPNVLHTISFVSLQAGVKPVVAPNYQKKITF
jgi:hypothetical protein